MTFILKKEILRTTKRNRVINYILLKEKVEIPLKNKTCTSHRLQYLSEYKYNI
jgi:hypothetical protein